MILTHPTKRTYQPNRIRRCVRVRQITREGRALGITKSFTRTDTKATPAPEYSPVIDLASGRCSCDCADFNYRKARLRPGIHDESTLCKHLVRLLRRLEERGDIAPKSSAVSHNAPALSTQALKPDYSNPAVRRAALEAADCL